MLFKIHIHPLFWLIIATAIITARFWELLILFIIVFIHELGHATAASFFSWRIKSVMLLPFGGVAEFDEHGNRPLKEELIVTLAGPIQHLWMMLLSIILFSLEIVSPTFHHQFIQFNLMILLFNCLPILPLDGGKLLYIFLSKYLPFAAALKQAIILSFFALFLYCLTIILLSPLHLNGWILAVFLLISLLKEWKNRPYVFIRFLLDRMAEENRGNLNTQRIIVSPQDTIFSAFEKFKRGTRHTIFLNNQDSSVKKIDEIVLLQAYFGHQNRPHVISDLLS